MEKTNFEITSVGIRLKDGFGESYEIPEHKVKLYGSVNKISFSKDIDLEVGENESSRGGAYEFFFGDLELDQHCSIGFFPSNQFEEMKVYIEKNGNVKSEGDYIEIRVSPETKADQWGQYRTPSVISFVYVLGEHSFLSVKEELTGDDSISNKMLNISLNLNVVGVYENLVSRISGNRLLGQKNTPRYRLLLHRNDISKSEELPPGEAEGFMDQGSLVKCKNEITLNITTNK
jgi:hypothetical protein